MTAPWIAAFIGLSVTVVILGLLVLGMLRRVAPLIERTEQVLSGAERRIAVGGLPPGAAVPSFMVEQVDGTAFSASDLGDSTTILLFLDSGCKACEQLVADLTYDRVPDLGVPLVVVSDERVEAQALARASDVTVLVDADRSLASAFDTRVTPTRSTEKISVGEGAESGTSRTRFLKQLGLTLVAGLGLAAAFASPAYAAGNCCKDCSCGSSGCGSGECFCFCDCSQVQEQSYCYTVVPAGCISTGCKQCPC